MITKQPKFVLKAKTFEQVRSASEEAAKTKTLSNAGNKDAKGSDRKTKDIIMESVGAKIDRLISEGLSESDVQKFITEKLNITL
jgi:hypothetical protein